MNTSDALAVAKWRGGIDVCRGLDRRVGDSAFPRDQRVPS